MSDTQKYQIRLSDECTLTLVPPDQLQPWAVKECEKELAVVTKYPEQLRMMAVEGAESIFAVRIPESHMSRSAMEHYERSTAGGDPDYDEPPGFGEGRIIRFPGDIFYLLTLESGFEFDSDEGIGLAHLTPVEEKAEIGFANYGDT